MTRLRPIYKQIEECIAWAAQQGYIGAEAAAKQRDTAALTDREKEILQGLAQGLSNKLIARNLDITEATVKVHVKNLLKKLGFHSRLEAAVWAVGRGTKLNA